MPEEVLRERRREFFKADRDAYKTKGWTKPAAAMYPYSEVEVLIKRLGTKLGSNPACPQAFFDKNPETLLALRSMRFMLNKYAGLEATWLTEDSRTWLEKSEAERRYPLTSRTLPTDRRGPVLPLDELIDPSLEGMQRCCWLRHYKNCISKSDWGSLALLAAIHHTACMLHDTPMEGRRDVWKCPDSASIKDMSQDDPITLFMRDRLGPVLGLLVHEGHVALMPAETFELEQPTVVDMWGPIGMVKDSWDLINLMIRRVPSSMRGDHSLAIKQHMQDVGVKMATRAIKHAQQSDDSKSQRGGTRLMPGPKAGKGATRQQTGGESWGESGWRGQRTWSGGSEWTSSSLWQTPQGAPTSHGPDSWSSHGGASGSQQSGRRDEDYGEAPWHKQRK
jgi:hypothetical protein